MFVFKTALKVKVALVIAEILASMRSICCGHRAMFESLKKKRGFLELKLALSAGQKHRALLYFTPPPSQTFLITLDLAQPRTKPYLKILI